MTHVMGQTNQVLQNQHGTLDELCGLGKFHRNNLLTFKGRYDPEGAQSWLQEIEKIFKVMTFTDAQKVLFGAHMMAKEAEYWWDNSLQRLEAEGIEITWDNFKIEFLEKYFPTNVHSKKEIEFLELKQQNMIVADYAAKFKDLSRLCPYYNGVESEGSKYKCDKYAYYKSVTEKKSGNTHRGKPYRAPADKGKQKATGGKGTRGGNIFAFLRCFSCGKMRHQENECKSYDHKCFKSGKPGHHIIDCKSNVMTCYNCGDLGHISTQFQKLKKAQSEGKFFALITHSFISLDSARKLNLEESFTIVEVWYMGKTT
ncbi:uncharacterized protein LOC127095468 [Lathyrus oleraceus]|uniref:uncharacterized protein LOC127095468 n=1 Tax=Pisum sativum TaxID=3888 RepID=UPI0021D3AD46|nr:uncharacterized protein LOC127095468 [Pisum sativum]